MFATAIGRPGEVLPAGSPCDTPPFVYAIPLVFGCAALALCVTLLAFPRSPLARFVTVDMYPRSADVGPFQRMFLAKTREQAALEMESPWHVLGPVFAGLFGIFFITVSLWLFAQFFADCSTHRYHYTFPDLSGALQFRPLTPAFLPFAGVAVVIAWIAVVNAVRGVLNQSIAFAFGLIFLFAAVEAAAFHTGRQANQWGAIAIGTWLAAGLFGWYARQGYRKSPP